jgi:hypothetical protein
MIRDGNASMVVSMSCMCSFEVRLPCGLSNGSEVTYELNDQNEKKKNHQYQCIYPSIHPSIQYVLIPFHLSISLSLYLSLLGDLGSNLSHCV